MSDGGDEQARKGARLNYFLMATVSRIGRPDFTARVRNLSAGGMMIETREELAAEEPVVIELRGVGRVSGRVAWFAGTRAGIAFAREIDPELARKPVASGEATPDYVKPIIVTDRKVTAAAKVAPAIRLN